jgi:hypothetical protein
MALSQAQIQAAANLYGGDYIEPSTREVLASKASTNPAIAKAIAGSISAENTVLAQEQAAQVQAATTSPSSQSLTSLNNNLSGLSVTPISTNAQAAQAAQAQAQAQAVREQAVQAQAQAQAVREQAAREQLENTAIQLGYSGDYTDSAAMSAFVYQAKAAQAQAQAQAVREQAVQAQVQAATTSPSSQSLTSLNNNLSGLSVTPAPVDTSQPISTNTDQDLYIVDPNRRSDYTTGGGMSDATIAAIEKQKAEAQAKLDAQNNPAPVQDNPAPVQTPNTGNADLGKTFTDGNTALGKTFTDGNTKIQGTINTGNTALGKTFTDGNTAVGKAFTDGNTAIQGTINTGNTALGKTFTDGNTAVQGTLNNWGDAYSTKMDNTLQKFGTEATNGFMGAFKNFAIPTSQQNGVNLGNYNDNRNSSADQWWSNYVTGRR